MAKKDRHRKAKQSVVLGAKLCRTKAKSVMLDMQCNYVGRDVPDDGFDLCRVLEI